MFSFAPYKPGTVYCCHRHAPAVTFVNDQVNGHRVLREMEHTARRQDSGWAKLRRAILNVCKKYVGNKDYIESACRDLQEQRESMPQRWLNDWAKNNFRVEPTHWVDAFRNPIAKARIRKY